MRRTLIAVVVLAASLPLSAQQSAGKVDRLIPAGFIARGQSTNEAKPADPVLWNDILRTNDAGRMRVGLDDGSMLSIGAHSELRVVKHDPASNQTLIELLYGKTRANVQPIHKQGGSFQVRTPTAVIGVLGTQVDIETASPSSTLTGQVVEQLPTNNRSVSDLAQLTPGVMPNGDSQQPPTIADFPSDSTIVRSLDHMVGVRNIEPKLTKVVFLLPGQYTIVRRGFEPTDPQFGEPPPAQTCTQPESCECSGAACSGTSDFYVDTQPEIDRAQRAVVSQAGVRTPKICEFETMTLALNNAVTQSGPGHSGLAHLIDYEITGRGTSTGNVFDVHVKNLSGCPLNVQIPAGVVLIPTGYTERLIKGILLNNGMPPLKDYQLMMAEGGFSEVPATVGASTAGGFFFLPPEPEETTFTLRGYCLELHKLAPHAKTKYKFADTEDEQRLSAPNLKIMETANKLFFTGQDNPSFARLDDLVQWSLWASREGITDPKKFEEAYVGLVKKNAENQNKKLDKNTKQQAEEVAQKFWPYIEKVLQAAK
jgi:hypothetical protein